MARKNKKKEQPPAFENIESLLEETGVTPTETAESATEAAETPEETPARKRRAKKERKPRAESSERTALLPSIAEVSPYTVLLAISLAAMVIAVLYLAMEFGSYGFDHKASGAKGHAAVPAASRSLDSMRDAIV